MSRREPQAPLLYYDSGKGAYWLPLEGGRYLPVSGTDAILHLRRAGLDCDEVSEGLKLGQRALVVAQIDRNVDFAGALAGYRPGPLETQDGRRVLVTGGPRLAWPGKAPKRCGAIMDFIGSLLPGEAVPNDGGDTVNQCDVFLAWMKLARESLLAGDFRPAQMMVLAGPRDCGKSQAQRMITAWLGGRAAKPYLYMTGGTSFNADLACAEHLVIDDENASTDIRSRRSFGSRVKQMTVAPEMSVHAKGRTAFTIRTYRRLSVSVNDEPENLMILPPMDGSIRDKVILLRCQRASIPDDYAAWWTRLEAELPTLEAELRQWKLPESLRCRRFGNVTAHHPELLEALHGVSPEQRLLEVIDATLFAVDEDGLLPTGSKTFTSESLEKALRDGPFGFAASKLADQFPGAIGTYLGRLKARFPERLDKRLKSGRAHWTIKAPAVKDD